MPDDRRPLQIAMPGCGRDPEAARMVFIRDTLTLDRLWVSPSLRAEVEAHPRLSVVDEAPLSFDDGGVMLEPWKLEAAQTRE